jgi:hypothetical protein
MQDRLPALARVKRGAACLHAAKSISGSARNDAPKKFEGSACDRRRGPISRKPAVHVGDSLPFAYFSRSASCVLHSSTSHLIQPPEAT